MVPYYKTMVSPSWRVEVGEWAVETLDYPDDFAYYYIAIAPFFPNTRELNILVHTPDKLKKIQIEVYKV